MQVKSATSHWFLQDGNLPARHTFSSGGNFRRAAGNPVMATIELVPDNTNAGVWWMNWVEQDEVIGRIIDDGNGRCRIAPSGPYWSPMKSFSGFSFDHPEKALDEVRLYFRGR